VAAVDDPEEDKVVVGEPLFLNFISGIVPDDQDADEKFTFLFVVNEPSPLLHLPAIETYASMLKSRHK
jgi:hypothetical protein